MLVLAMQTAAESGGQAGEIARTFGVDWPHLISQCISFAIVCGVLYALAYKPILRILEARRQQIAAGLANAEKIKAELARIESERQTVLTKAGDEGKRLIDEARAAAARVQAEETQKAMASAEQILARAREAAERWWICIFMMRILCIGALESPIRCRLSDEWAPAERWIM